MSNIKQELEKIKIPKELHERTKLGVEKAKLKQRSNIKRKFYKRFSIAAAVCLIVVSTLTFTPVLATIQEVYDKIFSSKHIDDKGVRTAIDLGHGQAVNQTFYDEKHDITVHFESVIMDDKETKLLLTYKSEKTNLENFYVDLFEGESSINLIVGNEQKKSLDNVGWGSRYYDSKENKVAEALSFESIKQYEGKNIRLEIENLTIYDNNGKRKVQTIWPLSFKLDKSAISKRTIVEINKNFSFQGETYKIKEVEFSALETRVVVNGSDTKLQTDESGMQYRVMSKLEHKFLNARKVDKKYGYIVDDKKSGVFLKSAGEKVEPIFSKGEVEGAKDEYIMIFAPVKDRQDSILEVGEDIKIPLFSGSGTIEKQAESSENSYIDELLADNGFTAEPLSNDEMKEMDLNLEKYSKEFSINRTVIGKVKNHKNSKVIEIVISQSGTLSEVQASNPEEAEKARKENGFLFIPIYLDHN
ncbi:DUF4179 domain-containing protein [Cytobacillus horneckiae]|uniref:DUF4179 domain-containing protein n=1 Tax=Cytobacillus horneckiae TaxID=549687 RepID=UPI003D9AA747